MANRSLFVSQFSDAALPVEVASSLCGPAAALAFARANGRNPTLREAYALAKQVGWTPEGGMNGFQNQVRLLGLMKERGLVDGFEAAQSPDWQRVIRDVQQGRPVTISTPRHYFTVAGYDPAKGFYVGTSGTDLKGGAEWMNADEIARQGRGVNGVIYMSAPSRERQQFMEANVPDALPVQATPTRTAAVAQQQKAPAPVADPPQAAPSSAPVEQPPSALEMERDRNKRELAEQAMSLDYYVRGYLPTQVSLAKEMMAPQPRPQLRLPELPPVTLPQIQMPDLTLPTLPGMN